MKRLSRTSFRLSSKDADKIKGSEAVQETTPPAMRDLKEFLAEAELSEYYTPLLTRLKVTTLEHLKYVKEEDLDVIGMTKPEMRRLKKFYRKELPHGTFNKLKKAIMRGGGDSHATMSPSPPEQRSPKPTSTGSPVARPPGRQLIPSDAIVLHKVLGEGEFGEVLQAVWTTELGDKIEVAVKKLRRERMNTGSQNFLKEAAITQNVDHDHVVRLYGVVLDQEDIMLVTELAPLRSLLECLKDQSKRTNVTLVSLCDFAQQVCDGMSYLETKRLVHRDLAARNILVFNKEHVKISDLGLSRALGTGQDYYQSTNSASLKLPIAWCAPECINYLKFTSASDVWAFGVMLWEFFTYGQQPWPGMNGQQILEIIDEPRNQRLEQPDLCPPKFYSLMKTCWAHDPEGRPTFGSLLVQLPPLRPTLVQAQKDYPGAVEPGYVYYTSGTIIAVVDKNPSTSGPPGLVWKGVLADGKSGLFDPTNVIPIMERVMVCGTPETRSTQLKRKESNRTKSRKIRADMISGPQNDLRHTGHIGYDGAVFGDVSFIGDNYDKLPVKVEGGASRGTSMSSIPMTPDSPDNRNGHHGLANSNNSLDDPATNGFGNSWMSRESLSSQMTNQTDMYGRQSPSYLDVEDDSLFADFKMPDLGTSFDLGPSFMDEVLKALDEKEKQVTSRKSAAPERMVEESHQAPPVPAPRESAKPVVPPLPSHPPRVDPPREKKQATVKPMSASEERVIDNALARARELTPLRSTMESHSPPLSPSADGSPGFVAKLRNSLRRSTSPKTERKRTFSDELENKGDLEDEVTLEAQQAYNALVVKGGSESHYNGRKESPGRDLGHHQHFMTSEPSGLRDTRSNGGRSQPRISNPIIISSPQPLSSKSATPSPPIVSSKPVISAPQLQSRPAANPAPVPAPRPVKPEPPCKKSEIPVAKPRPEIQRVEPTIRQTMPESPEVEPKVDRRIESHSFSRKESASTKEKDREDFKKTIEIVRLDDPSGFRDELSERASASFDRSSARSSQRSSLDRSDATSENAEYEKADWEHSECSSDSSRPGRESENRANTSFGSGEHRDSFNKKQSSLFEEDLSPSPQEIMSRLRERRLNRQIDHQRTLTGESEGASVVSAPRPRANAREPQGIPGRTPSIDQEDGGGEGMEEVDTNPLRMLRGGAIPIRTAGRGTSGMDNLGNRGAKALRVPTLNFSSPLCRQNEVDDHQPPTSPPASKTRVADGECQPPSLSSLSSNPLDKQQDGDQLSDRKFGAAAELTEELHKLTMTLMEGDLTNVAKIVTGGITPGLEEVRKFTENGHQLDFSKLLPVEVANSVPTYYNSSTSPSTLAEDVLTTSNIITFPSATLEQNEGSVVVTCSSTPPPRPQRPAFSPPRTDSSSPLATTTASDVDTPPHLPPRRSQSMSENRDKMEQREVPAVARLARRLRRSNSLEEADVKPPLPPRDPQHGGSRSPLSVRSQENKYPLTAPPPPPDRISPSKHPPFRRTISSPTSNLQQSSRAIYPPQLPPASPIHISSHHQQQHLSHSVCRNRASNPNPRSPLNLRRDKSRDLSPLSQPHCVELPPTSELSMRPPTCFSGSGASDMEPTHMLLDTPPPRSGVPSLVVSLPPSSAGESVEPTHIPLSWSSSALSASFPSGHHRGHSGLPANSVHPGHHSRHLGRSVSHTYGQSRQRTSAENFHDPSSVDGLSPPADLPPAPPAPSYRDKLRPKVNRSTSLIQESSVTSLPCRCSLQSSRSVDLATSSRPSPGRHRSSSVTSPVTHTNPTSSQSHDATSHHRATWASKNPLVSPRYPQSHTVFRYPGDFADHEDSEMGDDDAFFLEAPSFPHPYSQSPFHPIITTSTVTTVSKVSHTSPSSSLPTTSHTSKPPPILAPFSSLTVTSPSDPDIPPPVSPRTTSRLSYIPGESATPPPLTPRSSSKTAMEALKSPICLSPPPLTPRSSSQAFMQNHARSQSGSSSSSSPTHTPLPLPIVSTGTSLSPAPSHHRHAFSYSPESCRRTENLTTTGSNSTTKTSAAAPSSHHHPLATQHSSAAFIGKGSPCRDGVSSYGQFSSHTHSYSVAYEDLMQFDVDRQKNCEEIETLLKVFHNEVTVEECMQALEVTRWDITKAIKYLHLKKLLSVGIADVHRCKDALVASGWDVERAAESLLEVAGQNPSSSSSPSSLSSSSPSVSLSSSTRASPSRGNVLLNLSGGAGEREGMLSSSFSSSSASSSNQRPPSPETVDV